LVQRQQAAIERLAEAVNLCVKVPPAPPIVARVVGTVAEHYGLHSSVMMGRSRTRHICWPRQVATYIASELCGLTAAQLGRVLGHADHTMVLHSRRVVKAQMETDPASAETVKALLKKCTL
jgi:chromosomal replication initiator protein